MMGLPETINPEIEKIDKTAEELQRLMQDEESRLKGRDTYKEAVKTGIIDEKKVVFMFEANPAIPEKKDTDMFLEAISNKEYLAVLLYLRKFNPNVGLEPLALLVNDPKKLDNILTNLIKLDLIEVHNTDKYQLTPYGRNAIDRICAIKDHKI